MALSYCSPDGNKVKLRDGHDVQHAELRNMYKMAVGTQFRIKVRMKRRPYNETDVIKWDVKCWLDQSWPQHVGCEHYSTYSSLNNGEEFGVHLHDY